MPDPITKLREHGVLRTLQEQHSSEPRKKTETDPSLGKRFIIRAEENLNTAIEVIEEVAEELKRNA